MSKRAAVIPLLVLVVAALLFFVINGRGTSWFGGRAEQETDDAYVQADMTPLSSINRFIGRMHIYDPLFVLRTEQYEQRQTRLRRSAHPTT